MDEDRLEQLTSHYDGDEETARQILAREQGALAGDVFERGPDGELRESVGPLLPVGG